MVGELLGRGLYAIQPLAIKFNVLSVHVAVESFVAPPLPKRCELPLRLGGEFKSSSDVIHLLTGAGGQI
jgi:hypothetical protein